MSQSDWDDDLDDLDDDDREDWDDDDDYEDEHGYAVNSRLSKRRGCLWWCLVGWWWILVKWTFIGMAYLYFILPYRLIKWLIKSVVRIVKDACDNPPPDE